MALDAGNGTVGGSRLVFRDAAFVNGLVYSHEDITALSSFRVNGSVYAYRNGEAAVDLSDAVEVRQEDMVFPLRGFDPWLTPPSVSVRAWQAL